MLQKAEGSPQAQLIELLETLFKHGAAIGAVGNAVNACLANGRWQLPSFLPSAMVHWILRARLEWGSSS
ncbi:MAG: hypothetical protein M3Q91_09690 [Acidobacteriota bacterium]|nr:hypothetical protein [Acidobacteriota bacterium]